MIKYTEIEQCFLNGGVKVHEYNIEVQEDDEIGLPFVVYTVTDSEPFEADGLNYLNFLNITMAVISETIDFNLIRTIEDVFNNNGIVFDKSIRLDDDARLYTINYQFSVIDDMAENGEVVNIWG